MIVAYGDAYQDSYNIIRFACNLLDNDRLIFRVSFVNKTETSFCDWFFTGDIFIIERWQICRGKIRKVGCLKTILTS